MQHSKNIGRFRELGISPKFLSAIERKGFITPTPIQHQVIPTALQGKDVVGIAQTGTGKTLAFGIPLIQRIALYKGQGLILVPTRELAQQVEETLTTVGGSLGVRCALVMGGVSQGKQVKALNQHPHIVIATPGRLADLIGQGLCSLDRINIVILDEADRMLDIGFLPQIKRIMQLITKNRQTMLFSATMPQSISELASAFMKMPIRIEIAPQGTSAENVEQEVFVIQKEDKIRLLDSLLQEYGNEKILIFSRTKHGAKKLARSIRNMGHSATEIHSNRSQSQRKKALDGFSSGEFRIMVATDIAARGIDVKNISLVINYDLPDSSEDYVHRIGRTGRAGRYGKAISFVTPSEKADIKRIEKLIRKSLPVLALPQLPPKRVFSMETGVSPTSNKPPHKKQTGRRNHQERERSHRRRSSTNKHSFQSKRKTFHPRGKV